MSGGDCLPAPTAKVNLLLCGHYAPPEPLDNLLHEIECAGAFLIDPWVPESVRDLLRHYVMDCRALLEAVRRPVEDIFANMRCPEAHEVPTQEEYARALFESDPDVVRFVRSVADDVITLGSMTMFQFGTQHRARAMQVAWERNEGEWRTRAEARAVALIDAINRGRQ